MPKRNKTDWSEEERHYEEHSAIAWPTNISPELLERLRTSASTSGILVSIASEIYGLGEEFYLGSLDEKFDQIPPEERLDKFILGMLHRMEASGYRRVGSELLYFQEPKGTYTPFVDEMHDAALGSKGLNEKSVSTLVDLITVIMPETESKVLAGEVSKRVKTNQIEAIKVGLLKQYPSGVPLLDDLLKDVERELLSHSESRYYGLRGIKAGIERYKQLYQALTLPANT